MEVRAFLATPLQLTFIINFKIMAPTITRRGVDAFLRNTKPQKIHDDFVARVNHICRMASLKKDVYWDVVAEQQAEKAQLLSDDNKTLWHLRFIKAQGQKVGMWRYVAEKLDKPLQF